MNSTLTDENYEALSRYRQERAHETLAEIPYLREQGYYNTAVNRLYYACYYAAVAPIDEASRIHEYLCWCEDDARHAFCFQRSYLKGKWSSVFKSV